MSNNIRNKSLRFLNTSISISDVLDKNSKNFGKKIFLIDHTSKKTRNITYSEFNDYVDYCCAYFKNLGLVKRDIISLILDNSVAYLILYFASIRYGTILNPLPATLGKNIIEEKLEDVNPKIIFTNLNHGLKKYKKKIYNIDTDDLKKFIKLITKKKTKKIIKYKAKKKDIVLLYYSSGTTGKSKIIEYSNLAILENQKGLISSKLVCKKNIHLSFLPLYHTASLRYTIKFNLCVGGTVVLFKNFWALKDNIWKIINKYKINYFQAVPTILNVIVNSNFKKYKKPESIDYIGSGSSILSDKLLKNFQNKFNIKISNLYGLSEIGCSHFHNPFLKKQKPGTIGKILPGFKYKIFINNDLSTSTKKIGELGIKSQTLLSNYYKNKKLFLKSFKDGYFLTGDYVSVDKAGTFFYIDRKKDLIIKGGVNILPSEIENIIQNFKGVKEVAVIPSFDEFYGENICCFIVPKNKFKLDLKKLDSFCQKSLGAFKKPEKYIILKNLPKGISGKILKLELKKKINE